MGAVNRSDKQQTPPSYFPTVRALLVSWAMLMALTLGTMAAGRVLDEQRLGLLLLASLFGVTWLKAGVILRQYLNLRTVPAAADALMIVIGLILAIVASLYALG